MSDDRAALVTWGSGTFGKDKLTIVQSAVEAADPLKRAAKSAAREDRDFPQPTDFEEAVESEAPPVPVAASAEQIYGELASAGADSYAAEQVYETHNLDRFRFVSEMNPSEWIREISAQLSKATKQANITGAAAVVESGQGVSVPSNEEELDELARIQAGEYGSVTNPRVAKRLKELNASLGKAKVDAFGRGGTVSFE